MTIITNADGLDPAKKAELQKEDDQVEYVAQQIEERINNTKTEGQGTTPILWDDSRENVVTFDQLDTDKNEEFKPIIAMGYDFDLDGRLVWKLNPYQYEMVKQGKVCHACLEWQSDIGSTHCMWRNKGEGCGAERVGFANQFDLFGRK